MLVAQTVKNLPTLQETRVQSPSWEDSLEEEMATQSSILFFFLLFLPGELHGQRSRGATVHGVPKSPTRLSDKYFHFFTSVIEIFGTLFKNSR